ncbi:Acyl-CoA N-acyltransferase [Niveomyces insectorum RCEF 264]|uniref:Acyl-CoA N-acyltransferase n=1 Tax=Niveomyces insectorum RCEF 264 TaxID=1081102 RepID=A0A162LCN7_9HYPO|nr:Acyl-CoA N-acyltransferase [Niveomyces insectorum RCEF 264]
MGIPIGSNRPSVFHYEQPRLENNLVALEPFEPDTHAARFVDLAKAHPDVFKYVAFPVLNDEADFLREVYGPLRASAGDCLYAIVDNVGGGGGGAAAAAPEDSFAGVVSLTATNPTNAVTEIGIIVFPAFQRTHVATNALGLMLLWTLDPPSLGGLGLRRVVWQTHTENAASRAAALRMGFELEGIARWDRVFPRGSQSATLPVDKLQARNGTTSEAPGRHTAVFSLVWDEWDAKRPNVVALMERT